VIPFFGGSARSPGRPNATGPEHRPRRDIIDHKLVVENLSQTTTESDLIALFSGVGRVRDIRLATDRSTGEPLGIAYLLFADESGAARAVERLDGYQLEGSTISVRPASGGGGRGGDGRGGSLWGSGHAGSRPKGSRRGARGRKRSV
jgi:RNA recognition motif-containing protein